MPLELRAFRRSLSWFSHPTLHNMRAYRHMYRYVNTYIHKNTYAYTCTSMFTYMYRHMHMQVHIQIHRHRRLGGFCSTGCIDDCAGVVRPPLRAGLQCRAWSSAHDGSMGDMGWLDIAHVVFVTAWSIPAHAWLNFSCAWVL